MNVNRVSLETVCGITSKLPENTLPEIAFVGRSNVGKSSLLNVLVNRRAIARTSSQPGKTQTINFYRVEDQLYFTDLPGYVYANVSLEIKQKWGKMIEKYLKSSKQLQQIFLLLDIRRIPSEQDRMMYEWILSYGLKPVIIVTKLDKIKRSQKNQQLNQIRTSLHLSPEIKMIPFSAQTKEGREEIWTLIENCLKNSYSESKEADIGKEQKKDEVD